MTKVAFQGERGAYSEEAIYQFFGAEVETQPCRSLDGIFEAVEAGEADFGALPVENSTAGSINRAYDLLLDRDLRVWGEATLRVRHVLLAPPGTALADIQRVRSHSQALAQCERYLSNHGWMPETAYDTAGSARDLAAAPEPGVAVVASRLAGQLYGLEELDYGIEDSSCNYTRFFILSYQEPPALKETKHPSFLLPVTNQEHCTSAKNAPSSASSAMDARWIPNPLNGWRVLSERCLS